MSRCPATVAVVTLAPAGHLFDPRDTNVTVDPAVVATPYRCANHASVRFPASTAAGVGITDVKSPMKHTS
jgi:hypothetical protein